MNPHGRLGLFEKLALAHVGIFLAGATWAFGGNDLALRPYLALWGSLGGGLTLAAVLAGRRRSGIEPRRLLWLVPLALLNALVVASSLTPALKEVVIEGKSYFVAVPLPVWLPAAARPALALDGLWLLDGIYLSCFNLALVVRRRRALRGLLLFAAANALLLSVFGTLQRLSGAKGLYFGSVRSPQTYFFSTFIYHNHWGAFAVLMAGICLGLVRHYAQRSEGRDFFHTPAFGGVVAVVFLALTVPLSTSRSCTVLMAGILGAAFLGWLKRTLRRRRRFGESVAAPVAGAAVAILLGLAAVWFLAGDTIERRIANTHDQVEDMRARGNIGARGALYRDTWRMAEARILFGWGMDSYPYVFWMFNTQEPNPIDHIPVYYHDAHSDWLQAPAEYGLAGSALLALCALVPLAALRGRPPGALTAWPLAGCGTILLYAWVEFPFGNVAVVLCWWLCLFSAVRYAELAPSRAGP
jgi:O-antigen ligase